MTRPTPAELDAALREAMRRHWGYTQFRPLQREAMEAVSAGRDAVVVLPTGGGKSLCYQVPAVVAGPALVVSPLISLMQDQVAALVQCGVDAACVNSAVPAEEASQAMVRWRTGRLRLLYVAPERLLMEGFLNFLSAAPPAFIAVDEAHCISHWGHDFRPEYRQLSTLRQRFAGVPLMALTATATGQVRTDIAAQLDLRDPAILVGDFDRPNLHFRIERRTDRAAQVEDVLRAHAGKSGIVYCISRKDTESVAAHLSAKGFRAVAYHAGLDPDVRRRAQEAFSNEEVDAIVATVAFGMGIDRSNVRFVVHAGMPKTIEHYQQETGRAGRDGLPAECVLLYSPGDTMKWRGLLEKSEGVSEEMLPVHLAKLREMDRFASSAHCRHRFLVEYFGQPWRGAGGCGNCDVCTGGRTWHPDGTRLAQMILSCVVRVKERWGAGYVAEVLRGVTDGKVQPCDLNLSTFGLMKDKTDKMVRGWIAECEAQGLLARTEDSFPVLRVTPGGWGVMRGEAEVKLSPEVEAGPRRSRRAERVKAHREHAYDAGNPATAALFEALRKLRTRLAKARRVPPYVIFHDATLEALAQNRPKDREQLLTIPGMGERKADQYGDVILAVIAGEDPDHAPTNGG